MNSLLPLYRAILSRDDNFDVHEIGDCFDFALEAGLGPLLRHCTKACHLDMDSQRHKQLLGADMTARLLTGKQLDALVELAEAVPESISMVALKGMSAAFHYYPQPYMRTMGDIDLLVAADQQRHLEAICFDLGYVRKSHLPDTFYEDLHHSMPLYHPDNDVWIEVHTALFRPDSLTATDYIFSEENIARESGRAIPGQNGLKSLELELELVYVCAHWSFESNWTKAALRILDVLYMLRDNGSLLDWEKIFSWLGRSPVSAGSLYLMVSFLQDRGLIELPKGIVLRLNSHSKNINWLNRRVLHYLMDKYTLRGRNFSVLLTPSNVDIIWATLLYSGGSSLSRFCVRLPWNIAFPPSSTGRYTLQFQWSRIKRLFR
ncbi:MAG: nucleotidyltransferase family protein [Cellvibrionaceae bacterium]